MSMELVLLVKQLVSAVEKIGATLECLNSSVSQLVKNTQHQDVPAVSHTRREEHKKQAPTEVVVPGIPLPETSINEPAFREPLLQIHGPAENVPAVSRHQKMDQTEEPAAVPSLPSVIFNDKSVFRESIPSVKDYSSDSVTNVMLPQAEDNYVECQSKAVSVPAVSVIGTQGQTEIFIKQEDILEDYEENAIQVGNGFEPLQGCKKEIDEINEEQVFPLQVDESSFDENTIEAGAPIQYCKTEVNELGDEEDAVTLRLEDESSFQENENVNEIETVLMENKVLVSEDASFVGNDVNAEDETFCSPYDDSINNEGTTEWSASPGGNRMDGQKRQPRAERSYNCTSCDKVFRWASQLKQHMGIHTGEKPFCCSLCGKAFFLQHQLKRHLQVHGDDKPFHCTQCRASFRLKEHLKGHMFTHSQKWPFTCGQCGQGMISSSALNVHMRTHSGQKPFSCNECGASFSRRGDLSNHRVIHSGERPFSCDHCNASFSLKSHLETHLPIHLGAKSVECKECGEVFRDSNALKRHSQIHTVKKPFQCNLCGKAFLRKGNLVTHVDTHVNPKVVHYDSTLTTGVMDGRYF